MPFRGSWCSSIWRKACASCRNLVGSEPGEVRNELPVELVFVDYDGVLLPQFRLSAA